MKVLKRNIALFVFSLLALAGYSQQFYPGSQYIFNSYSLSPAMAGMYDYSEVFADYRTSMTDIDGHPRTINVNGFGNIYDGRMWLGGNVTSDKTGLLTVLKIDLSYTYKLQVENNQFLSFGIWTSLYQGTVDIADAVGINTNDPLLVNNPDKINSTSFNAGFGLNYNWNNLDIGLSMPALFGRNEDYTEGSDFIYRSQREFRIYASYIFDLSEQFKLKTMGVVYKTADEPGSFDLSATAIIHNRFWGGLLYRSGGAMDISIGAHVTKGFVLAYSYEVGLGNIYQGSGGAHEITLGFRFGFIDNDNYFESDNSGKYSESKKSKKRSGSVGYPEVQDFKYRRR